MRTAKPSPNAGLSLCYHPIPEAGDRLVGARVPLLLLFHHLRLRLLQSPPPVSLGLILIPRHVATHVNNTGEAHDSESEDSADTFTYHGCESDPDLLLAISQQAARKTADTARVHHLLDEHRSTMTTIARVAPREVKWVDARSTVNLVEGSPNLTVLPTTYPPCACLSSVSSTSPSHPRMVCPGSGGTSIMGTYRDLFSDCLDLCGQGLVVQLGNDENQTIPIEVQKTW